ncbi:MAG: Verru_Chthon cassette protein A, partial [Chthoniobacteraceae bacterium]
QLAESAVSLVMGQIRAATTVPNGCWASQPGMIRVYGNGQTAASKAYRFYKLYSSNNLVVDPTATPFDPTITDPANSKAEVPLGSGGWSAQPAFFTDLNEPADVKDPTNAANTVKRFPIFDPAVARINALGQNTVANPNGTWVEGCEIDPTGKVGNSVILNELTDPTTQKLAKAPMPVRWIYVLRDGTLTAPTPLTGKASGTSGLQAIWNNTANAATPSTGIPTRDNPIVGRMGFWTDDDTCKVNVNTAGGYIADEPANPNYLMASKTTPETNPAFIAGSYWDTPRIQTFFDRGHNGPPATFLGGLASSQPVRNEFQRYPGHPATTSLGLVLRGLLPVSAKANLTSEKLYDLTARVMSGVPVPGDVLPPNSLSKNSQGGSRQLITYGMQLDPTVYGLTPDPPAPMKKTFDTSPTAKPYNQANPTTWSWHLLSSVDEFYYTSKNFPTVTATDGTRTTANAELGGLNLTQDQLASLVDRSRFFLTAHSRSPELNLLGRPRVTIWPVPSVASEGLLLTSTKDPDTGKLGIHNPSDDLLRFCSTVPGTMPVVNTAANPYDEPARTGQFIFDRRDPYTSGTTPTGGNNLQADFWRPRNHQIFQYLQDVTSSNNASRGIPGWGGSFEAKYSVAASGRDQILTEIFDYIRTVNLKDTSRDQRIDRAKGRSSVTQPLVGSAESLKAFARYAPRGIVVPTRVAGNSTSGFGRFPTVSEVSLVFYHGGYIYRDKAGRDGNLAYDYKQVDERLAVKGSPYPLADKFYNTDNNVLTGQLMRAFLVIETFDPMQGYGPVTNFVTKDPYTGQTMNERIVYEITTPPPFTVTTKSGAQPLNLGIGQNSVSLSSGGTWGGRNFGGTEGFFHTLQGKTGIVPGAANYYPFQTPFQPPLQGIRLGMDDTTFDFSGGQMTLNIRYMDNANGQNGLPAHNELVQTLVLNWPKGTGWPVPITEREAGRGTDRSFQQPNPTWRTTLINTYGGISKYSGEGFRQDLGGFDPQATDAYDRASGAYTGPTTGFDTHLSNKTPWDKFCYNQGQVWLPQTTNAAGNGTGYGYGMPYFLASRIMWAYSHSWSPWAAKDSLGRPAAGDDKHYTNRFLQIVQPGDTIRSLVPGGTIAERTDPRTIALTRNVTRDFFQAHPDYNKAPDPSNPNLNRRAQTLRRGDSGFYFNPADLVWFGPKATTEATTGSLASLGKTGYMGSSGPD